MKHILILKTKEIQKLIKQINFIPKEKKRTFYLALKEGKISFITYPSSFLKWMEREIKEGFEEALYSCDFFNDSLSLNYHSLKESLKEKEEWHLFLKEENLILISGEREIILPLKKQGNFNFYTVFKNMMTSHKKHYGYVKSKTLSEEEQEEGHFYRDKTAGELKDFLKHLKAISEIALLKKKKENPSFCVIKNREEKLFIFEEEGDVFYSFEKYRDVSVKGKLDLLKGFELEEEGIYFNLNELSKFLNLKNKNDKIEIMLKKPNSFSSDKSYYLITLCQNHYLLSALGKDKHSIRNKEFFLKDTDLIKEKESLEIPLKEDLEEEKGEIALIITKFNFLEGILNLSSTCPRNTNEREIGLIKGKEKDTLTLISGSDVLFTLENQKAKFISEKLDYFIKWDKIFLEKLSQVKNKEEEIHFYFSWENENILIVESNSFSHKLERTGLQKASYFLDSVGAKKELGVSFEGEIEPLKALLEEIKKKVNLKRKSFYVLEIKKEEFRLWENSTKEVLKGTLDFRLKGLEEEKTAGFLFKRLNTLIKGMKGSKTFSLVESSYEGKYWQIKEGNTTKMTLSREGKRKSLLKEAT